jgi:photosystem II stability/assembly factor-like uncharacterized protein
MRTALQLKLSTDPAGAICHWFVLMVIFCSPLIALAHTPQDPIDSMEVSKTYDVDGTVFIIVQNSLLRSTDKGESWRQLSNGLDNRFVLSDVALSPNFGEDNTLFISSDGSGVYRSKDRGESWHRFNDGLDDLHIGRVFVVEDVLAGPTVLAAGSVGGLFVSSAADSVWKRAMPDDIQVTAIEQSAADPRAVVWIGDSAGQLWKSEEEWVNWQLLHDFDSAGALTAIGTYSESLAIVGSETSGLFRSTDGGNTFEDLGARWPDRVEDCLNRELPEPVPDVHIRDIAISPEFEHDSTIFVTTWYKAMLVSHDAGNSWELSDKGITCDNQAGSAAYSVPHFRNVELVSPQSGDWFLASFDGLFRSGDKGRSWIQLETLPVSLVRGLSVSPASGSYYQLAISTYGGGAYISDDEGQSWIIANNGLVTTRLADIAYSPDFPNDGNVFIGSRERLLHTQDIYGGWTATDLVYRGVRRWLSIVLNYHMGLPKSVSTELLLSDAERRLIWPMQIAVSPDYSNDQTIYIGHRSHGIWKSDDKGESWDDDWDGPIDFVTALEASPDYKNDETVFAAIRGAGLFRTSDANRSWQAINTGFSFLESVTIPESPNYNIDRPLYTAIKDVLLVVSPDYARDRIVFASSAEGVFKTTDGGDRWRRVQLPVEVDSTPVTVLAISPSFRNDKMLIAGFKGRGLYRSTDAARSFQPLNDESLGSNRDVRYMKFSPLYEEDQTIFAATDEDLMISRDGGAGWAVLERPVRYEDWRGEDHGPVRFEGHWPREKGPGFSASSQAVSETVGARIVHRFIGSEVVWRGECGPQGGEARIFIDGNQVTERDLYCDQQQFQKELVRISGLESGPHEIVIEVTGEKNDRSTGTRVSIDALDIESR